MIKELLDEYVNSKAMQKVFTLDRLRTIGASEIGQCARKIYWVKTAQQVSNGHVDRWGARVRGTIIEEQFWYRAVKRKFKKNLQFAGPKQYTFQDKYLSATPDGLVINQPSDALASLGVPDIGPSKCFLVESKTIDPRVNLIKAKEENEHQVQVQMGLVREMTKYKPDYALISYIDASFWDDVEEFAVKFDPAVFERAHSRAVKIKMASSAFELKPEGWITGGQECEWCPMTKPCGVIRKSVPEVEAAADTQFAAEITDLCRELVELKEIASRDEAKINEKSQEIKDRLRERSVRKIPGVVTWSPVKGSRIYDNKKIREAAVAAGIDVEEFVTTGEPTDRLQVQMQVTPLRRSA